jgi:hypothetical protein
MRLEKAQTHIPFRAKKINEALRIVYIFFTSVAKKPQSLNKSGLSY